MVGGWQGNGGILCIDHTQTPGHCLATVSNCGPQTEAATFHGEIERERGREGEQSPQLVIPRTRLALDERAKMLICFDNCKNHKINELGIIVLQA